MITKLQKNSRELVLGINGNDPCQVRTIEENIWSQEALECGAMQRMREAWEGYLVIPKK